MDVVIVLLIVVFLVGALLRAVARTVGGSTGRTVFSKHDQLFELPPGTLPSAGGAGVRQATAADVAAPVAVRFTPPDGVRPEDVGMLTQAQVQPSDVAAAFLGLAVDGYLHIGPTEQPSGLFRTLKKTWLITVRRGDQAGLPWLRAGLLQRLLAAGGPITMPDLKARLSSDIKELRETHASEPVFESWFVHLEQGRIPLTKCFTTPGARARTPLGSALRYQSAGFKLFLETADGERLRFEEGAGIFSRYLPWAVAYGVTSQWVQAFKDAAEGLDPVTASTWSQDLAWYGDFSSFDATSFQDFGAGLDALADSLGDALDDLTDSLEDLASDFSDAGDSGGGDGGGDGGGGD